MPSPHAPLTPPPLALPFQISTPHIKRSSVVNPDGSIGDDPIRTSWGTFLQRGQGAAQGRAPGCPLCTRFCIAIQGHLMPF